jgi:ankyrin repeat protein
VEHYAQRGMDIADLLARQDQLGRLPIHYAAAGWPGAIGAAEHGQDNTPSTANPTDDSAGDANTDTDMDADTMALLRSLTGSGNPRLTNAQDDDGETPLHHALSPNLITGTAATAVARFLCTELHASAKLRGRAGQTPLHRLWHHNTPSLTSIRLATLLLDLDQDHAAEVNAVDQDGNTPLHLAARHLAHAPAARFLVGRGANVRIRNNRGRTPLHEAAGGDLGVAGASVEERIRAQYGMLAVLCASVEGGLPLDRKWNVLVDEKDADGKTPREIAQEKRAAWRDGDATWSRPGQDANGGGAGSW